MTFLYFCSIRPKQLHFWYQGWLGGRGIFSIEIFERWTWNVSKRILRKSSVVLIGTRQAMYVLTLHWDVFVQPLLQWKNNKYFIFRVCVCSLFLSSMQSSRALLYCHLRPVQFYHIFPRYLINGTIFEKKVIEYKMCVLIFSTTLYQTFRSIRRTERDTIINVRT